ncbi:DUF952-domain-containing protein [Saccharata proteae CBS 121410]|uniref:DUF952-domain-containing protein n=1 Tax=Saccharata proteae CBS 121410 TaxID=1314787 RepID=A0A6A5YB93_9PEZI|nr:DUF952-domain-containing protein [Saccharata proteae CBS 121410]
MAASSADQPRTAFKILSAEEWKDWETSTSFKGASIDLADGYIHLSTAAQSAETYAKYFAGQPNLVLAEVDLELLGDAVKWEESRGGQLFPHVYGPIPLSAVLRVREDVGDEVMEGLASKGLL